MTTWHIGLDIAGTLRQPDEHLDGLITIGGRDMTASEVRHHLFNLRQKDPALTLFTGDCCDNQGPNGGCLGHPDKEPSE